MLVSIFNDVVGPVMRGPSSSHCAAALRIGQLARDLMDSELSDVLIEFDRNGSLATTHASQGSDMGLFGGFLGWGAADERLPESAQHLQEAGTKTRIEIVDVHDPHPNTYRLTLRNDRDQHEMIAISTGGGMIEVLKIDDHSVSLGGDYHVTLIWCQNGAAVDEFLRDSFDADEILIHAGDRDVLVEVRAAEFVPDELAQALGSETGVTTIRRLAPVLPVQSSKDVSVPFRTCEEMLDYDAGANRPLWELAVDYECARGSLSRQAVLDRMLEIVAIVRRSIEEGIQGTEYEDRILGHQSGSFKQKMEAGHLLDAGLLNRAVMYVTAMMEVKSSMGVILAAPTAGACAGFPGATMGAADEIGASDEDAAKAMLAGGVIGVFIATASTFAAEVSGCQAEGGSAAGMAAAALVHLGGGTLRQSIAASSMALQSSLGMICDPVANRVEVPCLGRNVIAASNGLSCANMAMADYDPVIPLDQVIETMDLVGKSLPRELRCTALGGLSITKTSKEIESRLCGDCAG